MLLIFVSVYYTGSTDKEINLFANLCFEAAFVFSNYVGAVHIQECIENESLLKMVHAILFGTIIFCLLIV